MSLKQPPDSRASSSQQRSCEIPNNDDDSDLDRILRQLRPFQRQAYQFATRGSNGVASSNEKRAVAKKADAHSSSQEESLLGDGRLLLCDEMGLGKSVTSLAIMMHYRQEWPLLILCPASLRHTWPAEIEKFLPQLSPSAIYVVQGFDDADFFDNSAKRSKIQIVVATYSLLQNRSAAARVLKQFKFKCVIADESHNLKQKNSQRAQLALPLLETAKRLVLLSGTPALARPVELWAQVYAIAPDLFGAYSVFTKHYCNARHSRFGWDVSGLSNADELHSKLKKIMIRRLKADVLDELPPKQRSVVPVPISKSNRKECENLIQELSETRESVKDLVGEEANGANFEARRLLMQAYQASGVAKAEGVCEYLLEWLRGSGTQKVLVFAHHKAVLDSIEVAVAKELKGAGHIRIDGTFFFLGNHALQASEGINTDVQYFPLSPGTVNSHERAVRVKKFQTSKNVRVAILSMTAAGVGLTLTAASSVMFAELHWTPGVLAQAEDRCHRIGQRNAVNVMYLVCEDRKVSVDMQLWEMLGRKVNNLGRVVDGERNTSLEAKRAEEGGSTQSRGIQSVQDELLSFFADTTNQKGKTKSHKPPAKGTILSFFVKQKSGSADDTSAASASIPTSTPKTLTSKCIPTSNRVQWDCKTCTFINSRDVPSTGKVLCEMCGAPFHGSRGDRNDALVTQESNLVTPRSGQRDKSPTSTTMRSSLHCKHESEIIVIDDEDCDGQMCQVNSATTLSSKAFSRARGDVIVLDDVLKRAASPEQAPSSKRVKRGLVSSIVPHRSSNDEIKEESEQVLLCFSVSKNSGRFMIHYVDTEEASLVTFDLEEILTTETVDRMLESKLNRKAELQSSSPLCFDDSATGKGKSSSRYRIN